jgi:chaperonin GroES
MANTSESTKNPTIKPLFDNVVIRPLSDEEAGKKSAAGIIIPETVSDKEDGKRGIVVAVGPGRWNDEGDKRLQMEVAVGDMVAFQSWRDKIKIDKEEYWVVSQSDIQAIIS